MADAVRLNALLPDRLGSVAGQIRDRLCQDEQVNGMKLAWDFVADKLQEALKSALDCRVVDILAECWARAAPVAKIVESAGRPSGEPCVIQLGEHELSRELKPVVAVTIGSCPCVELNFLFEVSAHIGGVRLSIVDGHIVGGDLGEAWASAQLSYEGVPLHPASESRKLSIGGVFEFASPGIAIPGIGRVAKGMASGG
jgi:hypothetical protein